MKYVIIVLFSLIALTATAQKKKAVFIIVDGIPADVIEKLPTPALDSIAGVHGYKRALVGGEKDGYSQTPTISAVGYNSVLTGTWANKHNVWGNYGDDIAHPNYNYKTIFKLIKDADPSKKIAIFSSWLDNRTKLVGESLDATGRIQLDYKYDSLEYDTVTYPKDTTSLRMHYIDEAVANNAAKVIREDGPDLSWVYLEYTDDMGHRFGDGPQFYESIGTMDRQMSRIWQAVQHRQKQFGEEWLVIITTDHGRDSATGKGHGGQSDRERSGWIVTNAKNLNTHYKEDTISIVDIMPTIASFMQVKMSKAHQREVDGTSLIGKIGATDLKATRHNNNIRVTWKNKMQNGKVKLWIATTNTFKSGKPDQYRLAGEFDARKQYAQIKAPPGADGFCKVVLETPFNTLNRWVVQEKKSPSARK
jgi:hypothetical protein